MSESDDRRYRIGKPGDVAFLHVGVTGGGELGTPSSGRGYVLKKRDLRVFKNL